MKPNTSYKDANGYEYFMCPFTNMYITQGSGSWSHTGVMANDVTNGDTSRAPYYAPFTCTCFVTYPSYGQSGWLSTAPVHWANGHIGYAMIMIAHDDSQDCYVGQTVAQGSQLGNMGTAGIGTGVHCHIQVGEGTNTSWGSVIKGYWTYGGVTYPTYGFVNEPYDLDDCYFVDDTNILYGAGGNWKTTGSAGQTSTSSASSSSVVSFDNMEEETYAVEFINDEPITIHNETSDGYSIGTMSKGERQIYTRKGVGNGHRWIGWQETVGGKSYKCVCAISGSETRGEEMWVKLFDPNETTTSNKEEETYDSTTQKGEPETTTSTNVKFGVDISEHNGDFDVTPYSFVILRATWGTNTDDYFLTNVNKCKQSNIPFGVYCYSYALDDEGAKSEADYLVNLLKTYNVIPDLGIWYDLEDADSYKAKNNFGYEGEESICKVFCDAIKKAGYYVGVYTTKYWNENYVHTSYPLWVANWGTNDGTVQGDFSAIAVMHQYAAVGGLDYDLSYVDFSTFKSEPKEDVKIADSGVDVGKTEDIIETAGVLSDINEQIKQTNENLQKIAENTNQTNSLLQIIIDFIKKIFNIK